MQLPGIEPSVLLHRPEAKLYSAAGVLAAVGAWLLGAGQYSPLFFLAGVAGAAAVGFAYGRVVGSRKWFREHAAGVELVRARRPAVVFLGDSVMREWQGKAGIAVWRRVFEPLGSVNLAIGGDRTYETLWRLRNGILAAGNPRVVVLATGANNITVGETAEETVTGVDDVVTELRSALPDATVLLSPIFPRGRKPGPRRERIAQANALLAERLSAREGVVWIDVWDRFVAPDGSIDRSLMPDGQHLSPAGYELWAAALEGPVRMALAAAGAPADDEAGAEAVRQLPSGERA